jgi:hypothetical protein
MSMQSDLDIAYDAIGEPARYNGDGVSVCCFRRLGQSDAGEYVRREAEARVRVTEVPSVAYGGDVLTYGGQDWIVVDVQVSDAWEHVLMLAREPSMQMG